MSQENVEVARRAYEAFNRGDIAGWLAMHCPEVELHTLVNDPERTVYHGHDEMRTWAEGALGTTEWLRFEPLRFIEAGEFLLVPVRIFAKGRGSGVPTEMHIFHVFEFSGVKIRRLRNCLS